MLCNLWLDLPKPTTYAHNGKEHFSLSIYSSINKLTNHYNTTATSSLVCFFLKLVSKASQTSTHAWVFVECHWSACTGSYLAENQHLTHLWCRPWNDPYFVTFWMQWALLLDHFTLKIAKLCCNLPLYGYPPLPSSTPV